MNTPESKTPRVAKCRNLRCKEMYYGAFDQQDEGAFPNVYWCAKTMENYGPDKGAVEREECSPERRCFEK